MRPRVAVAAEQFWHPVPGGTTRATHGTLRALIELDRHDLVGVAARHRSEAQPTWAPPIPMVHSRLPRPALYESWLRFGRPPVEALTGPVDVIWAAASVCPPKTAPMAVTVNDVEFLHHPDRLSARGRRFFPKMWRVALGRADAIVCPAQMVADDVVAAGADPAIVHTVPLGVEVPPLDAAIADEVRRRHRLPQDFVLWVGTLEPRKNLSRLVEALRSLDDVTLAVVGPDGWVEDGTDLLAPLGPRAVRVGRVSEADLHGLYAAATAFALPSLAEGFGFPVIEAMAHGTPVVTSAGTATEEVAGGAAVLVDPKDVESIAAGIQLVLTDQDLRRRLVGAGHARAADLTWEATGRGYGEVFDRIGR